jgi:tetratricopeptide (TPR) repeat protein
MILNDAAGKRVFVGRDKEINDILGSLRHNNGTKFLLVGESGIGKSSLLDEIYRRLTQDGEEEMNGIQIRLPFVGYYSKQESLIAESESLLYPFSIVLEKLVNDIMGSQQLGERIDSTLARVKKGLLKFGKDQGIKIGVAVLEDLARKFGLEQTLEIGKDILKAIGSEKTSLIMAQQYILDHRDEARRSYLEIFKVIAEEFRERRFVLIFDQFEKVGKASIDFFLNFVKFLKPQEKFDVIVSFRTDDIIWSEPSARKVYEDLELEMINELGANKILLKGLSTDDIDRWIKQVRSISLPLVPNLQRIRENSAGLPLLLNEWIKTSEKLDYEEIRRDKLCTQIIRLEKGLDKEDLVRLYKMSILLQPLRDERLAGYLGTEEHNMNVDDVRPLIKQLSEHRIFDPYLKWFKHELVKKCFEDDLDHEEIRRYHNSAAKFFESLTQQQKELERRAVEIEGLNNNDDNTNTEIKLEDNDRYFLAISTAYHLHMAGGKNREKSLTHNMELGLYASSIGDLDVAERAYKRAITDAECLERAGDMFKCLYLITRTVYYIWGRYDDALSTYQLLLHYNNKSNDETHGTLLNSMAAIYYHKGDYDQAMKLYNESLEIENKIGDREGMADTLYNTSLIHYKKGDYDQAMKLYNESLEMQKTLVNRQEVAEILNNIALIHSEKGEYDQAMKLYNESLEIEKEMGHRQGMADTLNNIANMHDNKGEYDQAMKLYNESLEIEKNIGDRQGMGTTLNNMSTSFLERQEYEESFYNATQAYEILAGQDTPELQKSIDILSYIKEKVGDEIYQRLTEEFTKS